MLLRTISTSPNTRLLLLKPRRRPRQRIMSSVTRISRRNCHHSRRPPHILHPLPSQETRIRNRHKGNTRNLRLLHKVRSAYKETCSSMLTCHLAGSNNGGGAPQPPPPYSSGSSVGVSSHLNPNPPSNAYYPNSRTRANTINHMDRIPPALARLQHMSQDVITGRNALTPVLNRDDPIKEWERRQSGKGAAPQPYPQLEYLQQQAELVASGTASWQQPATRYQPAQSSALAHQYHPPSAIVVDDERRDAIMSNVRATAQGQNYISNPPAAYTGPSTTAGGRFAVAYPQQSSGGPQSLSQQPSQQQQPPPTQQQQPPQQQQQQSPTSPFDSLDRRPDMGGLFVPLQPDHFQPYTGSSVAGGRGAVAPPAVPQSFYDPAVAQQTNAAPQRNLFAGDTSSAGGSAPGGGSTNLTKDRRGSGMEFWPR